MSIRVMEPKRNHVVPTLSALRDVEPPRFVRIITGILVALFLVGPLILGFVPWRQSVQGGGRVMGYAPLDRQFNIESPVSGRVREWYVAEGSKVKQGDAVARISDNDPQYLNSLVNQRESIERKLETVEEENKLYSEVAKQSELIRQTSVQAAENVIEAARQKVRAEEQEIVSLEATLKGDRQQFERISRLLPKGLSSSRDYEIADQKNRESSAKLEKAKAALSAAISDLEVKRAYLAEVTAKSFAELEKALAEVQKTAGKTADYQKEMQDMEVKIRRQQAQDVVASRDGTILRLLVNQGSEQVKEGEAIAVLVPEAAELAVEIWVDGNDAPLIRPGDEVRLQFEGWPSVQFAGWPSVAVGSFGGKVAFVDSTDDGKGKFRVVIRHDPDQEWPADQYLRQGVRAKGWVLLREVSLGYELWRRINGFPPVITQDEPGKSTAGKSPAKGQDDDKDKNKINARRLK